MPVVDYVELHAVSNFTFLRGASHPDELIAQAATLAYRGLALTDECSLAGVVRAHLAARENNIKLIIGSEFELDDELRLVLLATDRESYGNLSELITLARRAARKGEYELSCDMLAAGSQGCLGLLLAAPEHPGKSCAWFKEVFGDRGWLAAELMHSGRDREQLRYLQELSGQFDLPLVAAGNVSMHVRQRRALRDVLAAIRMTTPIPDLGMHLPANAEQHLRSLAVLSRIYPEALLKETLTISERCTFSLDSLRYEYPEELVPPGLTPQAYLRKVTEEGVRRRWPQGETQKTRQLVEHELSLIRELEYEAYFLTVYDIVSFARSRGILCQGRGSAANSAVCYCLGITEVDPARMEVLFERFLSKERNEPPDIDVDFENDRREEVIQYIYNKYGRHRAALVATVITYRPRSALRDAGRALGLSVEQVNRLSKTVQWWDGKTIAPERLREAGFDPDSRSLRRVVQAAYALLGFPRHLSQHVGGFVISRGPLSRLVPIENAAMPDRTVIQWDKDDLDVLGLLKVDCLALGMLSAIHRAFDLVKRHRGRDMGMSDIQHEDINVYRLIQAADTVGVFQIESRAQMSMLPRLKPSCFYDLVIEVAIVRPGPIQGDMVHPYLRRRQGLEPVSYPSTEVEAVLKRTLGIPIFQEQVIKLAMVAAGFTPGEADQLRRSMAAWKRKGGLAHFEQRLIDGMASRGYEEQFARQIFQQILGFGDYGFPESHAASFALLVYVSAWLKCYEPAIFTCALLNSQPMGFYAPAQLVQDARRHGVRVLPVNVLRSNWDCTIEDYESTLALRLGLRMVNGLSTAAAQRLVATRKKYKHPDVEQLVIAASLNQKDRQALAEADAFRELAGNRHQAHWAVQAVEPVRPLLRDVSAADTPALLPVPTEGENIIADYASLGLSLRRHPLELLRPRLAAHYIKNAEALRVSRHGDRLRVAGLVTSRQRPGTATGVVFVTLEDETGLINIIVWSDLVNRQRKELLHSRLLRVDGEVQREGEVIHVLARKLYDLSAWLGVLDAPSRDFR